MIMITIIDIILMSRECTAPKAGGGDGEREPCGLCKGEGKQQETCNDVSMLIMTIQFDAADGFQNLCCSTFVRSGASGRPGARAPAAAGRGRGRGRGPVTPPTSGKPSTGESHLLARGVNLRSEF